MKLQPTLFILLFLTVVMGCQQEDVDSPLAGEELNLSSKSVQTVTGSDIPHIMAFVNQNTKRDLTVTAISPAVGRSEADITVATVSTDSIQQLTNEHERSNYIFRASIEDPSNERDVLNYVVKDTQEGMYSFIILYRPDVDWLDSVGGTLSLSDYTGDILFYNTDGVFVHRTSFVGGTAQGSETRELCNDNEDNDNNNGNGDTDDDDTGNQQTGGGGPLGDNNGDNTDNGNTGGGGGGGGHPDNEEISDNGL